MAVVVASLAEEDVRRLGKDSALDLSARAREVPRHSVLVRLQPRDDAVHARHRHREAGNVVGDEALARAVRQIALVLGNLVHVERDYARAHRLPQRLDVLAVPRVALLRHGGRADLRRREIFENLADFAPLEVPEVVSEVRDDSERDVHLQEEAEDVLRLDKLVRVLARLQSQKTGVDALKLLGILHNHRRTVVRADGAGKFSDQIVGKLLDFEA